MARTSAASLPPMLPFWQHPAFRWGAIAVGATLLVAGMIQLERLNRDYQIERRLDEDASLGPMARELKEKILKAKRSGILDDAAKAASGQVPQALWLGRVAPLADNEPKDGSIVVLTEAHLLEGAAGPHDRGGQVRIGRRKFVFQGAPPKPGETWLISVWRDGPGNVIHSAARYSPVP